MRVLTKEKREIIVIGEIFNIACGLTYSLIQLVDIVNKILGKKIEPVFEKKRVRLV